MMALSPGAAAEMAAGSTHHAYSRKQKSLSLLCSNFVGLYNRDDIDTIGLDDAARRLGVERRRIYDIVNVLESVGILARKAKNRYSWIGFSGIPNALQRLKEQGTKGMLYSQGDDMVDDDDEDDKSIDQTGDGESEKLTQTLNLSQSSQTSSRDNRKEKSLGLLTQNFVKLFLNSEVDTISLEDAARLLLGDARESNMRTKVRRLYDIANVLSSLNLIDKTHHLDTRKPAFRWLGSTVKAKEDNADTTITATAEKPQLQSVKRAFGTDLSNLDTKRSRTAGCPTEMKLKRPVTLRKEVLKEHNSTIQKQSHGAKGGFDFGPFRPVGSRGGGSSGTAGRRGQQVGDWENLATQFRPQYQNQALNDLFAHYVEAWKSWYSEFAQGSSEAR